MKGETSTSKVTAALVKLVTRCPSEFERIKKLLRRPPGGRGKTNPLPVSFVGF